MAKSKKAPKKSDTEGTGDLLKIDVQVAGRRYEEDLAAQVHFDVNPEGLTRALVETPAMYAHWATLEVMAKCEREEREAQLEILDAQLFDQYSTGAKDEKVTEVRARVKSDKDRQALSALAQDAKKTHRLLRAGAESIKKKLDSVFEAARNYRAELQSVARPTQITGEAADAALSKMFPSG